MFHRYTTISLSILAAIIWGSTYWVTTEWLPAGYPITVAMLRARPAGLLLTLLLRRFPAPAQWPRLLILGGLNFTIFWICLFVAAYRLPGGVAATLMAIQPLIVIGLSHWVLRSRIALRTVVAAAAGVAGVGLLVLTAQMALDVTGIAAALVGAAAMALGTVLSKAWRNDTPLLTFTGWQLTTGGVLLVPPALLLEPAFPAIDTGGLLGLAWLSLIGALLSYIFWFNGIAQLSPVQMSAFGFLSPVTAILLGWVLLDQSLGLLQLAGIGLIVLSIFSIHTGEQRRTA